MQKVIPIRTTEGYAFLNAGCGGRLSSEWNNVDIRRGSGVLHHDLREPFPYPSEVFHAAYSAHFLEHLAPEDGVRFLREMYRVLMPGGVCRIVVPDHERSCQEYLFWLKTSLESGDSKSIERYKWSVMELIDQFVRERKGGLMLETLMSGKFDEEYVRQRNGDEFRSFYRSGDQKYKLLAFSPVRKIWKFLSHLRDIISSGYFNPQQTGEAHKWAYDRLSLRLAMEEAGFVKVEVRSFDQSSIPYWTKYCLDSTEVGGRPRKPDSLYMEGVKQRRNKEKA